MFFNKIFEAHHAQILSCFGHGVNVRLIIWPILLTFRFSSRFFHSNSNAPMTTTFVTANFPLRCVHTFHQPCGYPFFTLHAWQCVHKDPWCNLWYFCYHCGRCWFHVEWKQLHALLLAMFNSSYWQVNIVLTKDGIRTLIEVVIVNPMCANWFPWSCTNFFCWFQRSSNQKNELLRWTPHGSILLSNN
jgi:hypothetical protein